MTFEPPLVTEKVRLPDGAVGADRVHAVSVAYTLRARGFAEAPALADPEGALSVQAASIGTVSAAQVEANRIRLREARVMIISFRKERRRQPYGAEVGSPCDGAP